MTAADKWSWKLWGSSWRRCRSGLRASQPTSKKKKPMSLSSKTSATGCRLFLESVNALKLGTCPESQVYREEEVHSGQSWRDVGRTPRVNSPFTSVLWFYLISYLSNSFFFKSFIVSLNSTIRKQLHKKGKWLRQHCGAASRPPIVIWVSHITVLVTLLRIQLPANAHKKEAKCWFRLVHKASPKWPQQPGLN